MFLTLAIFVGQFFLDHTALAFRLQAFNREHFVDVQCLGVLVVLYYGPMGILNWASLALMAGVGRRLNIVG